MASSVHSTFTIIIHLFNHVKNMRNISGEIDLDKDLQVFLLEASKSGIWEYLVSIPNKGESVFKF